MISSTNTADENNLAISRRYRTIKLQGLQSSSSSSSSFGTTGLSAVLACQLFLSSPLSLLPFTFSPASLEPLSLDSSVYLNSRHACPKFCRFSLRSRRMCCLWERIINSVFKLCKGRCRLDVLLLEGTSDACE